MSTSAGFDGGHSSAKYDPTGTTTVRRRYGERLRGRMDALATAIRRGVAERDVLGLSPSPAALSAGYAETDRETRAIALADYDDFTDYTEPVPIREVLEDRDEGKVQAFMNWLNEQLSNGVLEVIHRGENPYIRTAYEAGVQSTLQAFTEAGVTPGLETGATGILTFETDESGARISGSTQFNPMALGTMGAARDDLQRLYIRNYENLEDITDDMADGIRETLTSGFAAGYNPNKMARELTEVVDDIGRNRATVLARTETINAHSEGAVTAYESAGGGDMVVNVEWLDTDDERTCPVCEALGGMLIPTGDVRTGTFEYEAKDDEPASLTGTYPLMPPAHPQCRCAIVPYFED